MLPLYEHTIEEAKQNGELQFWLADMLESSACAFELSKMLQTGENDPGSEQGKAILEEYGIDRVMRLLAIQAHFSHDSYLHEIQDWASGIVPPNFTEKDVSTWYIDAPSGIIRQFTERIQEMYARFGMLDMSQCAEKINGQDVSGKLLIASPSSLRDEFKRAYNQYFYAIGINEYGRITGYFLADGQEADYRPDKILGIADETKLPEWAAVRMSQIRAPQMQIRIFQIDHKKDPEQLAYEAFHMIPGGKVDASMYRQIYGGRVQCSSLEEIFSICNREEKPPGYYGESLSVSNVIEICEGEHKGFYYCDRVGFRPIDFDISQTDHDRMLRMLICEPGKEAYTAEIQDCLEAKQAVVGGLIEPVYFDPDGEVFAYCNEEGWLENLPMNRKLGSELIVGTFLIAGDHETPDGYCEKSLTDAQLEKWGSHFHYPLITLSHEEAAMYHITKPESAGIEEITPAIFQN